MQLLPERDLAEYVARHLRHELGEMSFVQRKFNQKDKMGNYSRLWFHDQFELTMKVQPPHRVVYMCTRACGRQRRWFAMAG